MSTPMTAFRPRKLTTAVEGTPVAPSALRDAVAIVAVSHDFVSQELRTMTPDVEKLGSIAGGRGK